MKVSLIVFVALISMGLLRKRSAALRHWVLAAAILCAGLTPLLGTIVPAWHVPLPKMTKTVTEAAVSTEEQFSMAAQPGARESTPAGTAASLLPAVWLAGTAISLGVLLVGLGRLAWLASRAHRVSGGKWAAALGRVQLLQSDHPTLLVTWGLARPKIIVPSAARDWSDDRLRIVLWHELAHIRRGDWLLQMMAELLRAVYWFNPLLWIACRRLRLESERACDDAVLSCGVEGPEYATELLGLARDLKQRRTWLPAPAMARPSSLERRVSAMLNTSVNRKPMTRLGRVATVAALLMLAIPIASAQSAFSTLSGNVIDTTGGPLPNVVMVLSNAQRNSKYEVRTNAAGAFEFIGLPAGNYTFDGQLIGFSTLHENLAIAPAQSLQRRITLHVGSLQETITVKFADADAEAAPMPIQGKAFEAIDLSGCVAPAVGGNIRAPKKLRDMRPQYPSNLRGTGIEGDVVMDTTIGSDGFPKNIEVREGANADLAAAAVAAVREWQYSQTILNCSVVEPSMTVTTHFRHQ